MATLALGDSQDATATPTPPATDMGPGPTVFVPQRQTFDVKIKGLFLLYRVEINRDRYLQVNGKK